MIRPLLVVVDDETTTTDLIEDTANSAGFEVKVLTRAFELQSFLPQEKPALMIIDLVIPDMDGLDLIQWLSDNNCTTPLILTSGYDNKFLQDATQIAIRSRLNIKTTFSKPLSLHQLEENLETLYNSLVSN